MKDQQGKRRPKFSAKRITVIGLGAAGRQVALLLAAYGVKKLQLIDGGTVRKRDVAWQGYLADDVGRLKVHATADICQQVLPQLDVEEVPADFRLDVSLGEIVFCCAETVSARSRLRSRASDKCLFWGEIGLFGDIIEVMIDRPGSKHKSGQPGILKPVDKGTLPLATLAASLLVQQFQRLCRGQKCHPGILLDTVRGKFMRRGDC